MFLHIMTIIILISKRIETMKKTINKIIGLMVLTVLLVGTYAVSVLAGDTKVIEVQDEVGRPTIFVKGIDGDVNAASALVGNVECPNVEYEISKNGDFTIDTLILIDNSLSIPNSSRADVKKIVGEFLASRSANERFCLATFGEQIEILVDFTDDYASLKRCLDSIEFQNRETYLTDVLYELIDNGSFCNNEDGAYRRVFVISDGVDNKSIGYTSSELQNLIKKTGVPVYALGVYNSKKSNSNELKNMFAISRETGADSMLLSDVKNPLDVVSMLSGDRDIVKFVIDPVGSVKDGSEKTVTISITSSNGEETVSVDNVRMPQEAMRDSSADSEIVSATTPTPTPKPQIEEIEGLGLDDVEGIPVINSNKKNPLINPIVVVVSGIILVITIVAIIVLLIIKNKKDNKFVEFPNFELEDCPTVSEDGGDTEIITEIQSPGDNGATVILMDESGRNYTLNLVDVSNPAKIFSAPLYGKVVIGRKREEVDICIDYDSSVSGKHCSITLADGKFYLENLNKSNGTYVNGERVSNEVEISSGSVIKMGRVQMRVEII